MKTKTKKIKKIIGKYRIKLNITLSKKKKNINLDGDYKTNMKIYMIYCWGKYLKCMT